MLYSLLLRVTGVSVGWDIVWILLFHRWLLEGLEWTSTSTTAHSTVVVGPMRTTGKRSTRLSK